MIEHCIKPVLLNRHFPFIQELMYEYCLAAVLVRHHELQCEVTASRLRLARAESKRLEFQLKLAGEFPCAGEAVRV